MQEHILESHDIDGMRYALILVLYQGRTHGYKVTSVQLDTDGNEQPNGETTHVKDFREAVAAYDKLLPEIDAEDSGD